MYSVNSRYSFDMVKTINTKVHSCRAPLIFLLPLSLFLSMASFPLFVSDCDLFTVRSGWLSVKTISPVFSWRTKLIWKMKGNSYCAIFWILELCLWKRDSRLRTTGIVVFLKLLQRKTRISVCPSLSIVMLMCRWVISQPAFLHPEERRTGGRRIHVRAYVTDQWGKKAIYKNIIYEFD